MTKASATSKQTSLAQRNLGLGYSTPIIGAVVALLTGLVISDVTQTQLDNWVWVLIQLLLGAGMVLGTKFATAAFNFANSKGKKLGAIKGARNLNLILGIIWSAVVTIMAFTKGVDAVQKLVKWPTPVTYSPGGKEVVPKGPELLPFTAGQFVAEWLPAFALILIAVVGIYLLLAERARDTK